jgi:hypothetical protein
MGSPGISLPFLQVSFTDALFFLKEKGILNRGLDLFRFSRFSAGAFF